METQENTEHIHVDEGPNTYMEMVAELDDVVPRKTPSSVGTTQTAYNVGPTQSQKRRRRFIPFKYHSKIFKASKKKRHVDDHRISTSSSSYASCKTFKKDSAKSNASSHTYLDIEECTQHIELERCNSIATEASFSVGAQRRTLETEVQGIRKASANDSPMNMNTGTQIQYQMELPKKTGRQARKYMVIFCMILVSAIISAAIASVSSTKTLRENIPADVEKQLSSGEFLKQTLLNVTNDEVMTHLEDLQKEVHNFANETKINNKNHFESLPSKRDMEDLSIYMKTSMDLFQQTLPNKTDMEDLSNYMKTSMDLLQQTLPNKTDFDVMKEENKENTYSIIHAVRCKTDCLNLVDGDYQSCYTCEGFITCSNGNLENRTCAPVHENNEIYWDDFKKECLFNSRTCDPSYIFSQDEID